MTWMVLPVLVPPTRIVQFRFYKDSILHIYYLAAREKPLFYPEEESNSYAFIL